MNLFKNILMEFRFLVIGFFTLLFFRLPSFFETFWYGDENYYLAVAQSIVKGGEWLYVGAWDNKPPLIYIVYSLSVWLFGMELWPLRVLNFLLGFLICFLVYKISKNVFNFGEKLSQVAFFVSIALQAVYFEVTIFNGENLFVPLVLLGFYFIAPQISKLSNFTEEIEANKFSKIYLNLIAGGLSFSLAILTKIPALAEIAWLIVILYTVWLVKTINSVSEIYPKTIQFIQNKKVWISLGIILISSVFLPVLIGLVYFASGYFNQFWFAVWQYNNTYYLPENSYPVLLGFIVPIKALYFRFFLVIAVFLATLYAFLQGQFQKYNLGKNGFIIINWLSIATFSVFIAERSYPHYLQQILPITAIFIVWIISLAKHSNLNFTSKLASVLAGLVFFQILLSNFTGGSGVLNYFNIDKYWGINGFNSVITGQQSLANWQRSFDPNTVDKTRLLVPTVQKYTSDNDKIFIASTMPEIYPLSGRLNAYKYVVDYHPLIGINEEGLYKLLVEKNTKLILIDSQSSLSKKLLAYLPQNYILEEQVSGRYSFWVKQN
jgi:4-amino-4-deoxy-L-arabinose transferase-like glycosyltransferase